ncbi:68_t:CDS:2 [Paraglomus occultum]|uniref:68_t:CDS:1 n=1 Tax=Paraglomus occultum TaxID=144539 RepID=A0A9N9BDQ3_9GLOM|nr:68_t:CDS:2 [Paraglomus occultum]
MATKVSVNQHAPKEQTASYKRPGFGDEGPQGSKDRKTRVLTNMFELKTDPNMTTYHQYTVEFKRYSMREGEAARTEPLTGESNNNKRLRRHIFATFQKRHQDDFFRNVGVAYDGGPNVFTTGQLALRGNNQASELIELEDDHDRAGKPNEFYIDIRENNNKPTISLDDLKVVLLGDTFEWTFFNNLGLKMLNAFLHHNPALRYVQFGESIFVPENRSQLGGGVDLWQGIFASVRPGEGGGKGKLFANVNVTYTTVYEPVDLATWLCRFLNCEKVPAKLENNMRENINSVLKHIKVRPLHRPDCKTKYTVAKLATVTADKYKFMNNKSGKEETVAEYFKEAYNMTLKSYHMIETVGSRKDLIPIECCGIVEGQRYQGKQLTGEQRANMIKITAKRPNDNKSIILDGIKNVLSLNHDKLLRLAGLSANMQMASVPGHFKKMPEIMYSPSSKQGATVRPKPDDGAWNLRDVQFIKPGEELRNWLAISFLPDRFSEQARTFLRDLANQARVQGMKVAQNLQQRVASIRWRNDKQTRDEIIRILQDAKKSNAGLPQLVVFIVEDENRNRTANADQYNLVKRVMDTEVGILSQCVQAPHIMRINKQYLANVALKLNLKLNGTNSSVNLPRIDKVPMMLIGADVTHPQPGSTMPSIAAVVGSVDRYAARYAERHVEQYKEPTTGKKTGRGKEEIDTMTDLVVELLQEFKRINKMLPKVIIMFRDGISESQFKPLALDKELPYIKAACAKVEQDYKPTITYIVVGKRHHTRFYPTDPRDADRKGNVKPGLIVEREITHPYLFDFYLTSHSSLQGTSRPCHYHVLFDENKFQVDEIQDFTNKLCYNFQRSTRAVSIPAPTYYAHCAAKRARSHLNGRLHMTKPEFASRFPMYYV